MIIKDRVVSPHYDQPKKKAQEIEIFSLQLRRTTTSYTTTQRR